MKNFIKDYSGFILFVLVVLLAFSLCLWVDVNIFRPIEKSHYPGLTTEEAARFKKNK